MSVSELDQEQGSGDDRHRQRQQRLKEKVDARIAAATEERGIFIIITGNGKGKSTSGFGTVTRAVGHGYKAAVTQFIKGNWECGERNVLAQLGVEFQIMATGFTWETQNRDADTAAAQLVWHEAKRMLADPSLQVVLLDELTYMVNYGYLDLEDVMTAIRQRPPHQTVIVTGRAAHRELVEMADTVSEIRNVKHAFESGIKAQRGVDW